MEGIGDAEAAAELTDGGAAAGGGAILFGVGGASALRASSSSMARALSSSAVMPEVALRNSAIALPSALAISGRRFGPSTIRATVRITTSSGIPMLNIVTVNAIGIARTSQRLIPSVASFAAGGYTEILSLESAPRSAATPTTSGAPGSGPQSEPPSPLRRVLAALRFDGLLWRKFARLGCVYGPEWWKRGSPPVIALAIFLLVGRNRRGVMENQARVLGSGAGRWRVWLAAYRTFASFARCMTETMEFYGPRPGRFRIDEPRRNHVAEALKGGRGVILATAHIGNWDISGRALHATGRTINMVMAREPNETTQDYARRSREQVGMKVIFSDSSVFSAFNMIRALRRNEILAIQIDRGAGDPTASVRAVPFFETDAIFQEGPFHLARLSGATVVPVVTLRRGLRHYEIVLGEPRVVSREIADDAERALGETVKFLERTIREQPEQWFQFSPFWPKAGVAADSHEDLPDLTHAL